MSIPFFLKDQNVLCLSGSDRKTFLQGLVTNDVQSLSSTSAIYTLLLTPQGRFLHDFFVFEHKDNLFIDVHKDQASSLEKRLNLYKLRADVFVKNVSSDYAVFACSENAEIDIFNDDTSFRYQDPRIRNLGNRWIVKRQQINVDDTQFKKDLDYNFLRLMLGLPQGYQDMIPEQSIPLESGVQDLNAISWTKGCYIGQELMARTRYRGEIRKRLFPIELTSGCFESSGSIVDSTGEKVGKLYSFQQNRGLARLKIDAVQKSLTFNGLSLKVYQPTWMTLKT